VLIKIAILAAATQVTVGGLMALAAAATARAWGWKASMEPQADGRRTRVWWLIVIGGCLAATGLVGLTILPACLPARVS